MTSGRSLAGFLANLPVILAAISRGVARAVLQLLERVRRAIWSAVVAIGNFIAEIGRWLWRTYRRIEFSIVRVLVTVVLSIWSLRLLVVLIAIAVVLAYFMWWIPLGVYASVMVLALLFYFRMSEQDQVEASEAQRPLKEWLTVALRWGFRVVIACTSALLVILFTSSAIGAKLKELALMRVTSLASSTESPTPHQADRVRKAIPSIFGTGPTKAGADDLIPPPRIQAPDVTQVVRAVETGILRVLESAHSSSRGELEKMAREAGREFDFSSIRVARNRKEARRLNEAALRGFQSGDSAASAYRLQKQAFDADPMDVEVAGNLAIYAFATGSTNEARTLSLYALGLPRGSDKTGRTADWNTLAAALARSGEVAQAKNALLVTLAIAPDVEKRCRSAIHAVKNTYGDVMKEPTTAMFESIRTLGLSTSPDCALPIQW